MLLLQQLCCYCYSDIEFTYNCYYKRVIASKMPRQTATLPLLRITSFATITTANASTDATVTRVALLTAVIVRMLYLHFQKVWTATQMLLLQLLSYYFSSDIVFATIATTNGLSILGVPGDTATLKLRKLLLLTSFAAVATAIAYADASVARVALLTTVIVRML